MYAASASIPIDRRHGPLAGNFFGRHGVDIAPLRQRLGCGSVEQVFVAFIGLALDQHRARLTVERAPNLPGKGEEQGAHATHSGSRQDLRDVDRGLAGPDQPGKPVTGPVIDDVTMTRPCPLAVSAGSAAWTMKTVPLKLTANTCSMSSGVRSSSFPDGKMPAFAHTMSRLP